MVRLGTRSSALALWQAERVSDLLADQGTLTKIVEIESFGDKVQDLPLSKLGEKGVFTKALDDALLNDEIDLAIHSLKDVPTELPEGLELIAIPERESPFDVLVQPKDEITHTTLIATGSIRRAAFWKAHHPEFSTVDLRGNVPTRINKVDDNGWFGGIFALAGLKRLGLEHRVSEVLEWMIPAPGQGALALICRSSDPAKRLYRSLNNLIFEKEIKIERFFLNAMDAGCSSPLGCLAQTTDSEILVKAAVLSPDGSRKVVFELNFDTALSAEEIGAMVLEKAVDLGARDVL